jgi:hypothetical protein
MRKSMNVQAVKMAATNKTAAMMTPAVMRR